MRLTPLQTQTVKSAINRVLGVPCQVWLFGSRVDDNRRGGDIDILVEAETVLSNRAETLCRLQGALVMALGERKLDILLKDARTGEIPVFEIARRTGVML